ncbi:hypothetical protein [Terricaulis silvestris]|uniref:Integral membrane protein n=1 Tax=Terricaulis silvestris TaxID=2686094 RepID=A0A6I6MPD5_9CAUL|nr:hypothetical protein [Terricaulis silvestris]QGZ94764.1 hypothetical protein DSM104635_01594 [Terricaulis silvestris]
MKRLVLALGVGFLGVAPARAQDRSISVQAICMDARGMPHPASQTFAERDVVATYAGELFRCLPGTSMRYVADSLNHDCAAGEALWYEDRRLSCRAEVASDAEQEREMLRQFGPGEKAVQIASGPSAEPARAAPRIVNGYARTR